MNCQLRFFLIRSSAKIVLAQDCTIIRRYKYKKLSSAIQKNCIVHNKDVEIYIIIIVQNLTHGDISFNPNVQIQVQLEKMQWISILDFRNNLN